MINRNHNTLCSFFVSKTHNKFTTSQHSAQHSLRHIIWGVSQKYFLPCYVGKSVIDYFFCEQTFFVKILVKIKCLWILWYHMQYLKIISQKFCHFIHTLARTCFYVYFTNVCLPSSQSTNFLDYIFETVEVQEA